MQHTSFSEHLAKMGLVDDRDAVVLGYLDSPIGKGLCLACVNGNILRLPETDGTQEPGEIHYTIPLKEITILKASSFVLNPKLCFRYQGNVYTLTRFSCAKEFLKIIIEENQRK